MNVRPSRQDTHVGQAQLLTPFLGIHAFFESNDEFTLQSTLGSQRRQQANERKEQGSKFGKTGLHVGEVQMSGPAKIGGVTLANPQ